MPPEEEAVEFPSANRRKGLNSTALRRGGQSLASLCQVLVPSPSSGVSRCYFWEASGAIWEGSSDGASSFVSLLQPKLWMSSVSRTEALRMTSCVF